MGVGVVWGTKYNQFLKLFKDMPLDKYVNEGTFM